MRKEKEAVDKVKKNGRGKRSLLGFVALAGLVCLLVAGGSPGCSKEKKTEGTAATGVEASGSVTFPLRPFIVNLSDKFGKGKRYLKVTMVLEIGSEQEKLFLEPKMAQLTDTILIMLSSQSLNDINSVEGKFELKQSLLSNINQVLGKKLVNRIFFTEFVVQ